MMKMIRGYRHRIMGNMFWFIAGVVMIQGCAITNSDNRPAFNLVVKHLWPDETGMRLAAAPVVIPLGAAALTADAVAVHPILSIDHTALDVKRLLWNDMQWREETSDEIGILPWRIVETPPAFIFFFAARSLFDIDGGSAPAKS